MATETKLKYFDELKRTMEWLAAQPQVMFVGQTVAGPGTFMFQTLRDCPKDFANCGKRLAPKRRKITRAMIIHSIPPKPAICNKANIYF